MINKNGYNSEIANAIHQHLKLFEFPYHFIEHTGIFMFPMGFWGTATGLIYRRRSAHEPYAEEAEYTLVENDT